MTELFDEEEKEVIAEEVEAEVEAEVLDLDAAEPDYADARRRLENMLEEKRLRNELEDFSDY